MWPFLWERNAQGQNEFIAAKFTWGLQVAPLVPSPWKTTISSTATPWGPYLSFFLCPEIFICIPHTISSFLPERPLAELSGLFDCPISTPSTSLACLLHRNAKAPTPQRPPLGRNRLSEGRAGWREDASGLWIEARLGLKSRVAWFKSKSEKTTTSICTKRRPSLLGWRPSLVN